MGSVVALTAPLLKRVGFRRRRHAFNRTSEPGLVQVVSFQMGAHNPPGTGSEANQTARERLGLPGDLYGRFTLNLGVYVNEMAIEDWEKRHGWINEYDCQLRTRIGNLLEPPADTWWSLDDPPAAHRVVDDALRTAGLPWLDRVASRDAILAAYEKEGRLALGLGPAGPVRIAWLLRATDPEAAEAVLRGYLAEGHQNPKHREWLVQTLTAVGLAHLVNGD